ncbi:MAG: rhodanese-related sulfurtransferase [Fibrobacterota bacterium]|nr:rhodanese-related sulfurtransferase [Fibrobacterota bacterium]
MLLYNTMSAQERAKWIDDAGQDRITLSFYKYHRIDNPRDFRDNLYLEWEKLAVLGRIYVAKEGINAQLSLPAERLKEFADHLEGISFLKGVRLNVAVEQDNKSFLKLKIKVRDRIVADGISDESFDASRVGRHLTAREFNALSADPNTLLVDMRNRYESEIGHFPGALMPDAITFRESLDVVESGLKDGGEGKNLVMYCTGGIRCEKASAWFLHKGFGKVFQLEGGIIEYVRQVKLEGLENRFLGKNYVFDGRMSERISDDVVSTCHQCDAPCDTHANCGNEACHMLFIQCRACSDRLAGTCSEACRDIAALPLEAQKALRKGVKTPWKYFKRE